MFAVGWGANQFSPMLIVYRHSLGLGPGEIAGLFAICAATLIPAAGDDTFPWQWHPGTVPCISTLEALDRAAADFAVTDMDLVIEPPAVAAARRSLEESGFLLLGEVHGVRENPLVIRSLMHTLGLSGLALEWHEDLAPTAGEFLAGGPLADHPLLWFGDGRITAGHLAVLRERAAAGSLSLTLFDGTMSADCNWSQRDEAMARRILAGPTVGTGTLVVAGNAHTPTTRTSLGMPLGACLAQERPGLREVRISYGGGRFYNNEPRRFSRRIGPRGHPRLYDRRGSLVLDLPSAREAVVPQRPLPWPAGPPGLRIAPPPRG